MINLTERDAVLALAALRSKIKRLEHALEMDSLERVKQRSYIPTERRAKYTTTIRKLHLVIESIESQLGDKK